MNRARLAAATAVAFVAIVAVVVAVAASDGRSGSGDGLPAVKDHEPATDYRVVYEVTTPDSSTREELEVHRPFDAHVTVRDAAGAVLSERWTTLGTLVTRAAGSPAASLAVAAAPATDDVRLDRFAEALERAGRLTKGATGQVGGRPCTRTVEVTSAATLPAQPGADITDAGDLTTLVDRCVDAQGIVLDERWGTRGGTRLLTKRAVELSLSEPRDLAAPEARALTTAEGNGSFTRLDPATVVPFAETFALPTPPGFTYVGRFAVVPPRLGGGSGSAPTEAELALYSDVWTRGPDLLVLDQGAGKHGATPFDEQTALRTITLDRWGDAELAADTRLAEVRLRRADGGFVRLAGTVALDELVALAQTIEQGAAG